MLSISKSVLLATLLLVGLGGVANNALATNTGNVLSETSFVTICHKKVGLPIGYVSAQVTVNELITSPIGHQDHEGDIIPSFSYDLGNGVENYPGKNLDNGGSEIKQNDCVDPNQNDSTDDSSNDETGTSTDQTNDDDNATSTDDTTDDNSGGSSGNDLSADLVAYKIVCDSETFLPNWGPYNDGGGSDRTIDPSDVTDFLAINGSNCDLVSGWEFEYGNTLPYPADGVLGASGSGTVFGPTNGSGVAETTVTFANDGDQIWVREVRQEGFVGFNGKTETDDVSAEIYCHTDLWHYDNIEVITLEDGATYNCIAFNAPVDGDDSGDGDGGNGGDGGNPDDGADDDSDGNTGSGSGGSSGGAGACLNCSGSGSGGGNDDDDDTSGGSNPLDDFGGSLDPNEVVEGTGGDDDGEVLGDQTTIVPIGAPNAGFGGTSGVAGVFQLFALFALVTSVWLRQLVGYRY